MVFQTSLELTPDIKAESLERADCDEWDSLRHMTLIVGMEDEFDIELAVRQVMQVESFQDALEVLSELGVKD